MLYVLIQFAMVLFHESHHLIILGLPSFVLCHIYQFASDCSLK